MIRSLFIAFVVLFGIATSNAHAQFTVGGVVGGAPTAGINCFGDADGKIAAYGAGWTPQDCGVYTMYCSVAVFPCPSPNFVCSGPADCKSKTTPSFAAFTCPDVEVDNAFSCAAGTATVGNGVAITYSLQGAPAWMTVNAGTGALSGVPSSIQYDDVDGMVVVATAGSVTANSSGVSFDVTKAPYFPLPVVCSPAVKDDSYSCTVTASDDDSGDTLTYTMTGDDAWMSLDNATGEITGTPTGATDVSGVVITATDQTGLSGQSAGFNVAVNAAPVFAAFSCDNGTQNAAYSCTIAATDADGDSLSYTIVNKPSWASFSASTGVLSGTPDNATTFSGISVSAYDGTSQNTASSFSILVKPDNANLANAAHTSANNGTLTKAQMDELLTNLGVTSGVVLTTAHNLQYVQSCVAALTSVTPAAVTGCATGATETASALWKVAQIATGAAGHPTSDLTVALLEAAGGTSGGAARVGATIAQLKSNITTSGLTTSSNGTAIDNWIALAAGFPSGTSYATVDTAITNGWSAANYLAATTVASSDWSNSAAHQTQFADCLGDYNPCTKTLAQWTSLKAVPVIAATATQSIWNSNEDVSYDISSLISNVPSGYSITNLTSGWSVSGGTISRTATITAGTVNFRIENAGNSGKYVSASFPVSIKAQTGDYRCTWGSFSGMNSAYNIGVKCRQLHGSQWEAMIDSDRTDAQKGALCDGHNKWTNWANWGRTSPRHTTNYISRQYHGNGSSSFHWHSSEHNCPGSSGCGGSSRYILCTKYN